MVVAEAQVIGEETSGSRQGDREINLVRIVRVEDRWPVETAVHDESRQVVGECIGRKRPRVGKEAIGTESKRSLAIGIRIVLNDQTTSECQVAGDRNQITDSVGRRSRARCSQFEDALGAVRENEASGDCNGTNRITGGDVARNSEGLASGNGDRADTREGLVGQDREAVRVGGDIKGSLCVGQTKVDVRRGCDGAVGGESQHTRSDIGRPGVAVGDSDRGRARADLPERAGASHDIGERVGITPIEYQCAVVGDGSRPEGAVGAVCPQLQGAIAADHGRHIAVAAEQGECSGTDLRQRSRSRDRVSQAVEA